MTIESIGPERDAELGTLLRAAFDDGADAAFAARVRGALVRERREGTWDVLAHWLRPGLAAAAAVILAVLLGMQVSPWRDVDQPESLADRLLAAETTTGSDIVLSGLVGDR
jgi:anti-sigma-K factor RskA